MSEKQQVSSLLRHARKERCLLRDCWEREAPALSGRMQSRLARGLAEIKPVRICRNGTRVPCEPEFKLRPKERRQIAWVMLLEGSSPEEILAVVPGLSKQVLRSLRKQAAYPPKPGSQTALASHEKGSFSKTKVSPLSFSSTGTDWLIHRRILELLNGGADPVRQGAIRNIEGPRKTAAPDWRTWVYGGARRPVGRRRAA